MTKISDLIVKDTDGIINIPATIRSIGLNRASGDFNRFSIGEVVFCLTMTEVRIPLPELKAILDNSFKSISRSYYEVTQENIVTAQQLKDNSRAYFENFSRSAREKEMTEKFGSNSVFVRYTNKLTAKEQRDLFLGFAPFSKLCVHRSEDGIEVRGTVAFGKNYQEAYYTWEEVADMVNFEIVATIWQQF